MSLLFLSYHFCAAQGHSFKSPLLLLEYETQSEYNNRGEETKEADEQRRKEQEYNKQQEKIDAYKEKKKK